MKEFLSKIQALRRKEQGFTLAELLVALLIFGVLVAIAVPLFINQRVLADDSELKADLANAAINLEETRPDNGGKYPDTLPESVVLTSDSAELKYTYPYDRMDYCLQIISGEKTFFKSSADEEPTTTDCTYEYVVPATQLAGQMEGFKPVLTWRTVAAATSYVIYKNNIPVETVTIPADSATKSTSYTLPAMNPEEVATFFIVVQDGATASPQSNSVTLTAPIPPPDAPTIKIAATTVKSPTTQQYTIQWASVKYAQGYEVWDVSTATPKLIGPNLGPTTTTFSIDHTRGESMRVVVKSKNTEGTSPNSNELNLSSEWPEAKIISAKSDPVSGKIDFVFQTVNGTTRTPDWGTPGSTIRLKVVQSDSGAIVFDQSGITTPTYTPANPFERVNHTATIIVTTATGKVLGESGPITIDFPKPSTPAAVTGVTSDALGTSSITPNRLLWKAVTCDMSAVPEYKVDHDGAKYTSGWIKDTVFDIPQTWLAQGQPESFDITARCVNANGISGVSPATNASFNTGINAPETPTGLTAVDRSNNIKWNAVTCATGTFAEYLVKQTVLNGSNVDNTYYTKNASYALADVAPGAKQTVAVGARCVQYQNDGTTVKLYSTWTANTLAYTWDTPMPVPAAPALKLVTKTITSPTNAAYQISWNSVDYAQTYQIFDASKPTVALVTVGINSTSTTINVPRGTTMNVFVKAVNADHSSAASNTVALADTWPKPVILDTTTDPYTGKIYVKWQNGTDTAPTPDWGTPGYKVKVNVYNNRTGVLKTYTDITAREFTTPDEFIREDHVVRIYVTTATGTELMSDAVTVSFPPPGPPAAVTGIRTSTYGPGEIKPNRIVWTQVSCGLASPEYLVTNTDGSGNSGWFAGLQSGTDRYFNIPDAWSKQGFSETYTVVARCANPNGASPASSSVSISFNASVLTPASVTGVKNDGVDIVTWDHSTAPTGLSREYQVVSVTRNGVASTQTYTTTNSTFTIPGLSPDTAQEVYVRVRFFNPANNITSPWSAQSTASTTSWVTPKPVPAAPVITLQGSTKASPTMQRYTISWGAVQWTESYRLINSADNTVLKDNIAGTATSTTFDVERGSDPLVVALQAYNTSGVGPKSNGVTLSAPWPNAAVTAVTTARNGSAQFTWQSGTYPNYTPDWGTPGYSVDVEVRTGSTTGAIVYSATNLTTPTHDSTIFADTSAKRSATHFVKITVTTATGKVIVSPFRSFAFERPAAPNHATNFRSDAGGTATVKNDRLLWDAVTCTQTGAVPQYWTGYVANNLTAGSTISTGWTHISGWNANMTSANIPPTYLTPRQGEKVAFVVFTRCVFPEGDASGYKLATVDGTGYHSFVVGLAPPTTNPANVTRVNTNDNIISWSAAVCATGTSPSYKINKTVHNGTASTTTTYDTTGTSYNLPDIVAGSNQSVQVSANCVKDGNATMTSSYGPYSAVYSYRAPLPDPVAPVIVKQNTVVASPTTSTVFISWNAVANAESYEIFNASTGARIATVSQSTTTYGVTVNRGSTGAVNVYVKAVNFSASSGASNTLTLDAPWPTPAIISATSNNNRQITATWQNGTDTAPTPDWGYPNARFVIYAEQPAGTNVYTSPVQSGRSLTFTVPKATTTQIFVRVTTANGEVLTSAKSTVNFVMPATPAAATGVTITDGPAAVGPDVVSWTHVTCTVAGTTPEYSVQQFVQGSATAQNASAWITTNTFTAPQSWLLQGRDYAYNVLARCTSGNGSSASVASATVNATRTNVLPPAAPVNFRVSANNSNGSATVAWDAVTCPTHLTAGYMVYLTKKNDLASTETLSAGTNTVATISALTPGTGHTAHVKARCYDATNTAITSTWAAGAQSNSASWTTPIPVPVTPTLSITTGTDFAAEAMVEYTINWNASAWATSYTLYDSATNVAVYNGTGTSFTLRVEKNTTRSFYVVATNGSGTSSNSNVVTAAPVFATPVISRHDIDSFTLRASFYFQNVQGTWGTGATARMISPNYGAWTVTGTSSFAKSAHVRADRNWYLEVTTSTGKVLTSSEVTISPVGEPTLALGYDMVYQMLTYGMSNTPAAYGLDSTNSSWKIEVSDTASFAKTYPQSASSGTDPSVTSDKKQQPTHGGGYYARYVITRNSDGATLASPAQSISIPTMMIDRLNDGNRDVPITDTAAGSAAPIWWVPTYSSQWNAGGQLNTANSYKDPYAGVGNDCIIMPIMDFSYPGSEGIICWKKSLSSGGLYYYELMDNGNLAPVKTIGTGWNMYDELAVVQNWWGDDHPAIAAINKSTGALEMWRMDYGSFGTADRDSGNGWGRLDSAKISAIHGIHDWGGYGDVGILATSTASPWQRYYDTRQDPTFTGRGNIVSGVALNAGWNQDVGPTAGFPSDTDPTDVGSYVYARGYGNLIRDGKVVPGIGFGPLPYYDVITTTGSREYRGVGLNWGYNNDSSIRYPFQNLPLTQ